MFNATTAWTNTQINKKNGFGCANDRLSSLSPAVNDMLAWTHKSSNSDRKLPDRLEQFTKNNNVSWRPLKPSVLSG